MADPEKAMDTSEGGEDDVEDVEGEAEESSHIAELMKNPEVLAAVQSRLGSIIGTPSGYIASLPKIVKRRIKALKKLQLEATKLEAKFYEEVHTLECKYAKLYTPLYEKRNLVTSGQHEPTDEESEWPSDDEKDEDELSNAMENKAKLEEEKNTKTDAVKDEDVKGIPEFWLTICKNVDELAEMVQEHDEPILKHLKDIKVKLTETTPMGFVLEFVFDPNEYFTNTLLTKEYELNCAPEDSDPFSFEGPEIVKCKGCTIDWCKGKNVTVKTIKKKQKHKSRGSVRTVTKTVQNDSFFNFFNPPSVPDDKEAEVDEETRALLAADFEIGHFIRERIIPRAVLYFTGEALDDDEYEEEEGEEEEGGEEGEEEDEDDPDYKPQGDGKGGKKGENPAECKQQ